MREHLRYQLRKTLAEDKHNPHHTRCIRTRQIERTEHSVVFLRAVVITSNRLHSLIKTHYHHRKHERQTVNHTVRSDRHVTTEVLQLVIDDDHHKTMRDVIKERRHTDRQRTHRDMSVQPPNTPMKSN